MTLLESNDLDLDGKPGAVWRGSFLAGRTAEEMTIQLYRLPGFYAKVFYDAASNKISDIRSFTSNSGLAPYVALKKIQTGKEI
ncbi:hypothetical protein D0C36_20310 [Mucilaginibacter conchicola]|uniref:Uncharacterized protein n=1 Tax=Mucilaginibacter conchicola TaxID=2303333 RepID=A0A372NR22_9SPHI|nr:hypothetical protein [Mucilaginibacter conchicola]RFZ91278.1 hypothetical protein D0C36_20310 [Mucilaginibacter conchicola]